VRNFLGASPLTSGAGTGDAAVAAMRMRRIIHEASLAKFLIFVNQNVAYP
jgi:hypothetical protein